MKFAAIIATALFALASVEAIAPIPKEHHARFLSERDTLIDELDAWKASTAGREAKKNHYYKEDPHESTASIDDQLRRLFLTKLSIEQSQKENPEAKFTLASPFSLMTDEEFAIFVKRSSGDMASHAHRATNSTSVATRNLREMATSVDWTTGKCIAAVKDQGYCGGCWAFSSVSTLESAICLKTGKLTTLSEQELVSCDTVDGGCDGGLITTGISYLQDQGAVATDASYPYISGETEQSETCSTKPHTKVSYTIQTVAQPAVSEAGFIAAITKQPVGVAIAASSRVFKQYSSGILSSCTTTQLDHAVVAVGYDAKSFKIRNSWGSSWGEKGYVRLARLSSSRAACGLINDYAAYPVLA